MKETERSKAADYLEYYTSQWDLVPDGERIYTHSSLLQPVRYEDKDAMLKIPMEQEEKMGSLVMAWWNGHGAAKVLRYDANALLMERITGNQSLLAMVKAGNDAGATRILCAALKKLHTPREQKPDFEFIPLEEWFKDLWPAAEKFGGVLPECAAIARELLDSQNDIAILHGDVHHGNVLYSDHKGWVAIDPKRLIGERAFDYVNIFCNPDALIALASGRFERQLEIISAESNIASIHLLKWTIAWCGLSASWILDSPHEGETADIDLGVAQIALRLLASGNL